jgi:uncharacterized membrane protein YhiD involved in acid resistance
MIGISTIQFALRLLLAIGMGAMVGVERQWRQRMAGTRSNALVAAGAAAFVMCGLLLEKDPSARGGSSRMSSPASVFSVLASSSNKVATPPQPSGAPRRSVC